MPEPGWLARLVDAMGGRDDVLAGGRVVNGVPSNRYAEASQLVLDLAYGYYDGRDGRPVLFAANNLALPAALLARVDGFDESLAFGEDRDLVERLRAAGATFAYAIGAVVRHEKDLDAVGFVRRVLRLRPRLVSLPHRGDRPRQGNGGFYRALPKALRGSRPRRSLCSACGRPPTSRASRGRPEPTCSRACVADPLRLGLVGCGRIAESGYVPALLRTPSFRLAAVADPAGERCQAVGRGLPSFAGIEELLGASGVDAVVIASPPGRHLPDAEAASAAGVPSLVEKPPGRDAGEAPRPRRPREPTWLGLNRRFDARWQAFDGPCNTVLLRPSAFGSCSRPGTGARTSPTPTRSSTSASTSPTWRCSSAGQPGRSRRSSWSRSGHGSHSSWGAVRPSSCSRTSCPTASRPRRRTEHGRPLARHDAGAFAARARDRLRRPPDRPLPASLARQLEAFAAAVRGENPPRLATAADGVAVLDLLDAARASAQAGGASTSLH